MQYLECNTQKEDQQYCIINYTIYTNMPIPFISHVLKYK